MTTEHTDYGLGIVFIVAFCLAATPVFADTSSDAPAGYQPGWQIQVRRAGPRLDQPTGKPLAQFAAPSSSFDMGSYRGAAARPFDYGVAYDAQGLLNIAAGGPHRIAATVGWDTGEPGPEATCDLSLSLEGRTIAEWHGPILILPDTRTAQGNADLQPGLHPTQLRMACDRAVGARVAVAVTIKTPSDSDLRPLGPAEIVHPDSGAPAVADHTPPEARSGTQSGPPPEQAGPPPGPGTPPAPPVPKQYQVGDCRQFQTPATNGTQKPQTYGLACLQPDGKWRVVR